ncbi:MAG: nucleoside phosphorylase, partial [Spirochaetaceae bacterium]
ELTALTSRTRRAIVAEDSWEETLEALAPHLRCSADNVAPVVLLPGDPGRCEKIAAYLENPVEVASNREFKTVTGSYRGMPVSATSTGIGGASLAIAVEELVRLGAHTLVRVGSAGAVLPDLAVGDLVIAEAAMREDGTSRIYAPEGYPAAADPALVLALRAAAAERETGRSGAVKPDSTARETNPAGAGYQRRWQGRAVAGLVRSHDSFYTGAEEELMRRAGSLGVLASDMETAALLVVARLRNVVAGSVLTIVVPAEGALEEGIGDFAEGAEAAAAGEYAAIAVALEGAHTQWRERRRKRNG